MVMTRRTAEMMYGYSVDEVARFLQYDESAVRYWLRTGHLRGRIDPAIADWRVTANDLVTFLRQSSEPMPTGVIADPADALDPVAVVVDAPPGGATVANREPILVDTDLAAAGSVIV